MSGRNRTICVYCASSGGRDPSFAEGAVALGRAIADGGHTLVYGGGSVGLMGAVADGALDGGGRVIGVIPESMMSREIAHTGLAELITTEGMHQRKAEMERLADAFIVLPGGFGTLDEALEILTWNQIGSIVKPVVFLDIDGYYEPLFGFFDHAVEVGLLAPRVRALATRVDSIELALVAALAEAP